MQVAEILATRTTLSIGETAFILGTSREEVLVSVTIGRLRGHRRLDGRWGISPENVMRFAYAQLAVGRPLPSLNTELTHR